MNATPMGSNSAIARCRNSAALQPGRFGHMGPQRRLRWQCRSGIRHRVRHGSYLLDRIRSRLRQPVGALEDKEVWLRWSRTAGIPLPGRRTQVGLAAGERESPLHSSRLGCSRSVLPIIKFNPPAHGQQYWSGLDIALQLQATLHPETPLVLLLFVPFGLVYLTLFVAMGAVLLFPFRKALRWISLAGLFLLVYPFRGLFGAMRLAALFQSSRHGGGLTTLWAILGITVLAVAGVAWTDTTA